MIKYAKDCTIAIELKDNRGEWVETGYPIWSTLASYRIKPKPERKPFNIEEALAGNRVVTNEGDEVTQLTQFKTISYRTNIYGVVKGIITCWNGDGSYGGTDYKRLYMYCEES